MRRVISACVLTMMFAAGGAVFAAPTPHSTSPNETTTLANGKARKTTVTCGDAAELRFAERS